MRKRNENSLDLTISHFKILLTVKCLNAIDRYPTSKGVSNILKGKEDSETILYKDLPTFASLISIPSRRFSSLVNNLVRHNYLIYVYDQNSDAMYLSVSDKGEIETELFLKKHPLPFKKKISPAKREIIEIKLK